MQSCQRSKASSLMKVASRGTSWTMVTARDVAWLTAAVGNDSYQRDGRRRRPGNVGAA